MSIAPSPNVGNAVVWVEDGAGGQRTGEHVHPEVSPAKILLQGHLGAAHDLEVAVPDAEGTFSPRHCDVNRLAVDREFQDRERGADDVDPADRTKTVGELVEREPDDDVVGIGDGRLAPIELRSDLVANASPYGVQALLGKRCCQSSIEGQRAIHGALIVL